MIAEITLSNEDIRDAIESYATRKMGFTGITEITVLNGNYDVVNTELTAKVTIIEEEEEEDDYDY